MSSLGSSKKAVIVTAPRYCYNFRSNAVTGASVSCTALTEGVLQRDLHMRFGRLARVVRCCCSPGGENPPLETRKTSHVFEPPNEGCDFADSSVALAQAQIRPESVILVCIGHCSITNLSRGLVIRGCRQCDSGARFPGGDEVYQ